VYRTDVGGQCAMRCADRRGVARRGAVLCCVARGVVELLCDLHAVIKRTIAVELLIDHSHQDADNRHSFRSTSTISK